MKRFRLEEAVQHYASLPSGFTFPGRYSASLEKLGKLARDVKGDRLVVHLIGVGSKGGPQVREAIEALKRHTGKTLEVHLIDKRKARLDNALRKAKEAFPDVNIVTHHMSIAEPTRAPWAQADVSVCTNVLWYIAPKLRKRGIGHLSSFMKEGGLVLVDEGDLKRASIGIKRIGPHLKKEFGLKLETHAHEKGGEVGKIYRRVSKG
jgi:hypothetical protein